jgi:hypothetical protein
LRSGVEEMAGFGAAILDTTKRDARANEFTDGTFIFILYSAELPECVGDHRRHHVHYADSESFFWT